jgi:CDP-4-dehydro-6-deoxyglucose reductase
MNRESSKNLFGEHCVTIAPSGKQFSTRANTTLLEAGLGAGVALPHRCSNGSCGDCRARLLSGDVETTRFHDYTLTSAEKAASVILLCSNGALSDLSIEINEATDAEDIPLQQLNTRICHLEPAGDLLIMRLKILRGKALWYLPGQYATVHLADGLSPTLPIASCPCEAGYLEFHLPVASTGAWQPAVRERIRIEGPLGSFTVQDSVLTSHHHVFIATEQRFAAVKPMIEHLIATEDEPDCTLIHVAAKPYRDNLCRSWADAFDWFTYHTVPEIPLLKPSLLPTCSDKPLQYYISTPENSLATVLQQVALPVHAELITDSTGSQVD